MTLTGNTHPLARPEFDQGAAAPDLPMNRMLLVLKRGPEQEAVLLALLDGQQNRTSASYRQWQTPAQFGQQFGPADQDVQVIVSWLGSHGFQIGRISQGRTVLEFSGTAGQVAEAFHTEIHRFVVDGVQRWANANDPQIPEALLPVVAGVNSLHNFPMETSYHSKGIFSRDRETGKVTVVDAADFSFPSTNCNASGGSCYAVGPYDFATIYDVLPLWNATPAIDGTGQSIAILAESNINIQDVRDFRTIFGLPAKDPVIIVDGPDPSLVSGVETEAVLDTEWAGAVAKGATIKLVVTASTNTTTGVDLAAVYAVDNNLAPVLSESFGQCELFLGTAGNIFQNAVREQAAAQGITYVDSSGDEGSARCDPVVTGGVATHGLAVSGLASSPFDVAVGGTDFINFGPNLALGVGSPYWAASGSNGNHQVSALGYVPESTWNSTCTNNVFVVLGYGFTPEESCSNNQAGNWRTTLGGGGGKSACTTSDGSTIQSCAGGYAKPPWQRGPGVPGDGARDIPDVALFASSGFLDSFYVICESDQVSNTSCNLASPFTHFLGVGGTSVAAPSFAGIMALVNQYTQSNGQGDANYVLYSLAASPSQQALNCNASGNPASGCIFNDVTVGTIEVPCQVSTPNCIRSNPNDTFGLLGYDAGAGYDLATGLGSVNAFNLVHGWSSATFVPTSTTLSLNPTSITHGDLVTVSIGVTTNPPGSGTPTGDVSVVATGSGSFGVSFPLDGNGVVAPVTSTTLLGGGSHNVVAHYEGDATFGASDSAPMAVTVLPEPAKTSFGIFVPGGRNIPITSESFGEWLLIQSHVSPARTGGVDATPTGSVTFTDTINGTTSNMASSPYKLDLTGDTGQVQGFFFFTTGMHTVDAIYSGDNNFAAGGTGSPQTFTVGKAGTSVTAGAHVTDPANAIVTATVTTGFGVGENFQTHTFGGIPFPTGTINLSFLGQQIGDPIPVTGFVAADQSAAASAQATFLTSMFPVGQNLITVVYSGDANYAGSVGNGYVTVVASTSMTLTTTNADPFIGTTDTFTAQIIPSRQGGPSMTGSVQFSITGGTILGNWSSNPVPIVSGSATGTLMLTNPRSGTYSLVASYPGDSNYAASSSMVSINIPMPDFTFTSSPAIVPTISVPAGGSSSPVIFTITGINGYNALAVLNSGSCAISPGGSNSACIFNPNSITGSGSTQMTIINSLAPRQSGFFQEWRPRDGGSWMGSFAILLAGIFIFTSLTIKRTNRGLAFFLLLLSLLFNSSSCGGGGGGSSTSGPPAPTVYTMTVTASAPSMQGGDKTISLTFTIN